jgi:hypothetical protein
MAALHNAEFVRWRVMDGDGIIYPLVYAFSCVGHHSGRKIDSARNIRVKDVDYESKELTI